MICFIALGVFAILSLFSAKYRPFARQAFDCVFRRMTLRPCNSTLEEEVKSKTVAALLVRNEKVAQLANRHWELLSWGFTLLMFISLAYAGLGFYNFLIYGDCNGPNATGFCPFKGAAEVVGGHTPSSLIAPATLDGIQKGPANASVTVVEFGCYSCPYTKEAEPWVQQLLTEFDGKILFVYKHFPLPTHNNSREAAIAALCSNQEGRYWDYRKQLFDHQVEFHANGNATFLAIAGEIGLQNFTQCFNSASMDAALKGQIAEGLSSRIYGTPTFFINGRAVVAPGSYNDLANPVREELAKAG